MRIILKIIRSALGLVIVLIAIPSLIQGDYRGTQIWRPTYAGSDADPSGSRHDDDWYRYISTEASPRAEK
jgi:hypothetical protein